MRNFEKIIEEICKEKNIVYSKYINGWVMLLETRNTQFKLMGYEFPLNDSTVSMLCGDRSAVSDVLSDAEVPVVTQYYLANPSSSMFDKQPWTAIDLRGYLDTWEAVVCKPNTGPCGDKVFVANTEKDLIKYAFNIFKDNTGVALSKYVTSNVEYRVIILYGEPVLLYKKEIPNVTGDGKHTVSSLLGRLHNHPMVAKDFIPMEGVNVPSDWRYNTKYGAQITVLDRAEVDSEIITIAQDACSALGCKFACVDVLSTCVGYKVIEVKTSIRLDKFSSLSNEHYSLAKNVYGKAIDYLLMRCS